MLQPWLSLGLGFRGLCAVWARGLGSRAGLVLTLRGLQTWRFPETRGTFLGVPIIRIRVVWGLYGGLPVYRSPRKRSS